MNTHQVPNESQDVKSKCAGCNIMEHLIQILPTTENIYCDSSASRVRLYGII